MARVSDTPYSVYYHMMSGDPDTVEQKLRAKRMGYEMSPDGRRLINEKGEQFSFDPESATAQVAGSSRNVARATGGMGGAVLGAPGGPPGAAVGGMSGSMMAGAGLDAVMEHMTPSNTPMGEEITQVRNDLGEEVAAAGLGRVVEAMSPYARSLMERGWTKAKSLGLTIKNGVDTVTGRILNERPAADVVSPSEEITDLLDAINRGDLKKLNVEPDVDVMRAAERMGLVLPADMLSNNARFIQVAQGLKSGQGSFLREGEAQAISGLNREVDDILDASGNVDVAGFSEQLLTRWKDAAKVVGNKAGDLYNRIKIPNSHKFKPLSSASLLNEKKAQGPLLGIYAKMNKLVGDKPLTYAHIDDIRKLIGEGYKNKGPFKDTAKHQLDEVYAALSEDQMRAARIVGLDKELALAHKLSQAKFGLQEKMTNVFGNQLQKDLASTLEPAITGLHKGRYAAFDKLMDQIPAGQRKEVAGAGLKFFLTQGKPHITQSFVTRYEMLLQNKAAMARLYKHLPKDVTKRIDDVYQVSKGIFRSVQQANHSKSARDLITNMDASSGMLAKVFGRAAGVAAESAGIRGGSIMGGMFKPQVFSVKADELLGSPKFAEMLEAGVKGESLAKAELALSKTKAYRSWIQLQDESVQDQIISSGLFRFFWDESSSQDDESSGQDDVIGLDRGMAY